MLECPWCKILRHRSSGTIPQLQPCLQGLALGFVLLRVESLVEEGEFTTSWHAVWKPLHSFEGGMAVCCVAAPSPVALITLAVAMPTVFGVGCEVCGRWSAALHAVLVQRLAPLVANCLPPLFLQASSELLQRSNSTLDSMQPCWEQLGSNTLT